MFILHFTACHGQRNFSSRSILLLSVTSVRLLLLSPPDGAVIIHPLPSSSSLLHPLNLEFAQLASVAGSDCGAACCRSIVKWWLYNSVTHTRARKRKHTHRRTDLQLRCQAVARGLQAGALNVQSVTSKAPVSDTH